MYTTGSSLDVSERYLQNCYNSSSLHRGLAHIGGGRIWKLPDEADKLLFVHALGLLHHSLVPTRNRCKDDA